MVPGIGYGCWTNTESNSLVQRVGLDINHPAYCPNRVKTVLVLLTLILTWYCFGSLPKL